VGRLAVRRGVVHGPAHDRLDVHRRIHRPIRYTKHPIL
jgi:hypothetical protein